MSLTTSWSPGWSSDRQIANDPVVELFRAGPHHEKPCAVARLCRPQRDALGRQLEVEEVECGNHASAAILAGDDLVRDSGPARRA